MTILCSFSCRFQIYRRFFFIFSSLGDNSVQKYYGIFEYFELRGIGAKGQGRLQSLTSDISAITRNFQIKLIYLDSLENDLSNNI